MSFELGLAAGVSLSTNGEHKFRVMDAVPHRITQSLSDLGGYDAFIHRGSPGGVFEAVSDMFGSLKRPPVKDAAAFRFIYSGVVTLRRETRRQRVPILSVQATGDRGSRARRVDLTRTTAEKYSIV